MRVIGTEHPVVQVFSIALADIETTPELLAALNDLNAKLSFARAFHVRGQVLMETDILAESLDPAGFRNACNCVGSSPQTLLATCTPGSVARSSSSAPRKRRQPQAP